MGKCSQGRPGGWPRRTYASMVAAAALLAPGRASLADDFREWRDTSDVFMNTSASGANVATTLIGFPLLVRLNASNFDFSESHGRGRDIRFTNVHGTPLPHHVERWDSAGAKAELWVMADTVKGNNSTQRLRMYWNNFSAADSGKPGAVFPASKGLVSVFHMGGSGARSNAVGGAAANPAHFDGDESRAGIVGLCDSLDGGMPGDYLDLGAGYADFSGGFTYSAWIYPSAVKRWAHVLDLGNPVVNNAGVDNIVVGREDMTNHLITHLYLQNNAHSPLRSDGYIVENAWQFVTVAISNADSSVRWYKNGALIDNKKMAAPLSNAHRVNNWMGRSAWAADDYFQGKLDEVRISKVAHSATWIKLSYESQRPDQIMVTLKPPARCASTYLPPADRTVNEGATVVLSARADCAGGYSWSAVSGPAPRILDPGVKELQFTAPRTAGDALIVLKFTAQYGDSTREKEVRVTVKEAIPEPAFTLPATLTWNGQDSLRIAATVSNLAAIKASRDSILTWEWSLENLAADSAWRPSALVMRKPTGTGEGKVTLCLSNNATPVCRSTAVIVQAPTSLLKAAALAAAGKKKAGRLANGRKGTGAATAKRFP